LTGFLFSIWVFNQDASHQGDWNPGHQILPKIEIKDNIIKIGFIRDFRYGADGQPTSVNYYSDQFAVSDVKKMWFGLSQFGGLGMAHNLVSFEFEDGRYLVLSVEARTEQGQGYNPVLGLFRQYEMMYVIGTEQDVIGLRSFVRKEPLYLYPMALTKSQVEKLLVTFFQAARVLEQQPRFYNTMLHNCLSQLLLLSGEFSRMDVLSEWRILLPGYSYEVAYEMGYLDQSLPIEHIKAASRVDFNLSPDDSEFSRKIRLGCQNC